VEEIPGGTSFNVVDDVTRKRLAVARGTAVSKRRMARCPHDPIAWRGEPKITLYDNGS
jgi:hypothetical protein